MWCDGLGPDVTEKMLQQEFAQFGKIQDLIIDRSRGHALVYFDQVSRFFKAILYSLFSKGYSCMRERARGREILFVSVCVLCKNVRFDYLCPVTADIM